MTPNQAAKVDALGNKLAEDALRTLIRICPEVKTAAKGQLDAVCAAMRMKNSEVIDQLCDDLNAAPWVSEQAYKVAALTLAQAGASALRGF